MWFSMPEGCSGITVERQAFVCEIKDDKGIGYFRAPDHFAPRILQINGFKLTEHPPEGAPEDLPKADPLRDGAIEQLTRTVAALQMEVEGLHSDMAVANARIIALNNENALLKKDNEANEILIANLREEIEDLNDTPASAALVAKKK